MSLQITSIKPALGFIDRRIGINGVEYKRPSELASSDISNKDLAQIIASLLNVEPKRQASREKATNRIFDILGRRDMIEKYEDQQLTNEEAEAEEQAEAETTEQPRVEEQPKKKPGVPKQSKDLREFADWEEHLTDFGDIKLRDDGYPKYRAGYVRTQLRLGRRDFKAIAGEAQILYPNLKTYRQHVAWDFFDMKRRGQINDA